MLAADMLSCCNDGDACSSPIIGCTCGDTLEECADLLYGTCDGVGACDNCPCIACDGRFRLCQETLGCAGIFECMRSTRCVGQACSERCSQASGGNEAPRAFEIAEALWACAKGAACGCDNSGSPSVQCSGAQCSAYVTSNATLEACCPAAGVPASETTPPGACGLRLERYFASAPSCSPLAQPSAPRSPLLETCPSSSIGQAPYNGARLQGCCREADGTCGYWDDVTGLGCLEASIFQVTAQPCL